MTNAVLVLGKFDLKGATREMRATSPAQSRVASKLWEYGKKMYSAEVSGLVPAIIPIFCSFQSQTHSEMSNEHRLRLFWV